MSRNKAPDALAPLADGSPLVTARQITLTEERGHGSTSIQPPVV